MHQNFPTLIAKLNAGYNSENLQNKIHQIINFFTSSLAITKKDK